MAFLPLSIRAEGGQSRSLPVLSTSVDLPVRGTHSQVAAHGNVCTYFAVENNLACRIRIYVFPFSNQRTVQYGWILPLPRSGKEQSGFVS